MVFESLVVDVLNRFLGDYVVNLDSSQLQLGIWGVNSGSDFYVCMYDYPEVDTEWFYVGNSLFKNAVYCLRTSPNPWKVPVQCSMEPEVPLICPSVSCSENCMR
ncbi:hypothetical protein E2320_022772 [Naja naja]|nr:hypothetical protein E2320_022772 [Naja naja]